MVQIKHNKLRIPTGERLTSWLYTQRGEFDFGATEDKSIQWQGVGCEPGTSGLQVQRPTTRPRLPPQIWSRDTGQRFPCLDSCNYHNMDVQYQRSTL